MAKELPNPPDRLQATRIHYVCPCSIIGEHGRICASDVYRDTRQETVKCGVCQGIWRPDKYREGSYGNGVLEANPHPERYDRPRCAKHGIPDCSQCAKEELYAE